MNAFAKRNINPLKLAAAVAIASAAILAAAPAGAGECPADQVMAGATKPGATMPAGVTDEVLASIDLSSKGAEWKGHLLRMRKLVVQPGGVVPWHEHSMRPANILIASGAITEYRSSCKVPIEHVAGDVAVEFGDLAHWWKNNDAAPAVLYSADILPPEMTDDHTM
ncbi:cupin [Aquibium sp. LZ166]|uniref:Cupin n=1 Tax=Aquibium pacificus TaxID=3153579 RepID=A0ABV3SNC3_9HYPH